MHNSSQVQQWSVKGQKFASKDLSTRGILFDEVFTGKKAKLLWQTLKTNPELLEIQLEYKANIPGLMQKEKTINEKCYPFAKVAIKKYMIQVKR